MEDIHEEEQMAWWKIILSGAMLVVDIAAPYIGLTILDDQWISLAWYVVALVFVGLPVMKEAWEWAVKGDVFSEFMLMTITCIGAFAIGEYPEAVAVMLLYCTGEASQDRAVDRVRDNIRALVVFRPTLARVVVDDTTVEKQPVEVAVGDVIEVKVGGRVPLDGTLLSDSASLNTAALTGEPMPQTIEKGEEVMVGIIAVDQVLRLKVTRPESQSAISHILKMVEGAAERKAPTELFIRRFARIYTPIVVMLVALTISLPYLYSLFNANFTYVFDDRFRRALVFLVISCPCTLVISVPLGYFVDISSASKRDVLFRGSSYLDAITEVDLVMFDKAGTLIMGEFTVQSVGRLDEETFKTASTIEKPSNHPIAKVIVRYCPADEKIDAKGIAGHGLQTDEWLVDNLKLLERENVFFPDVLRNTPETMVCVAHLGRYVGHIILADKVKDDAKQAVESLPVRVEVLSGDRQELVSKVASSLGIHKAYGDLLPKGKVEHIEQVKHMGRRVAFMGDGISDALVLALSDVGIAMGGLGSDMAIETADIIIQTDQPSKVADAIRIGKYTHRIVNQSIWLVLIIKALVMLLGLLGLTNLWMAVFTDSGVALLAVLNSSHIFLENNK